MENNKLNAVFQYIDDVLTEDDNNLQLLTEDLNDELKRINEKLNPFFKTIIGIMSVWGAIIIPIQIFDWVFSLILFGIFGIFMLILFFIKIHIISRIRNATMNRKYMYIKKRKCFLNIRKEINFYHNARVDVFLQKEDMFTEKVNRNILWALYNLANAFNIFNLDYQKLLYKASFTYDEKLECIDTYFKLHSKLLDTILLLSEYQTKGLPFFIKDQIRLLINDHLKYLPEYYLQPDAKIPSDFDISLSDWIHFRFGGMRKLYKYAGYQKTNLIYNTLFRKRFFIDRNFNVLKIK